MKHAERYPMLVPIWLAIGLGLGGGLTLSGCGKAPSERSTRAIVAENPTQLDKTFDDLKFDIEPDAPYDAAMLTDPILDLDGEKVRIRGYILPSAQSRLEQFVLVRDNQECCFGPGAALYDCVLVTMAPGKAAKFSIRPVAVEGEFALREFRGPDGRLLAIFQMIGETVE